jgi:hypothetical protein
MILVDYEVIGQHEERDSRQIHLKKTGSFIASITDKSFITPGFREDINNDDTGGGFMGKRGTHQGGPSFLKIT